ncbi:LOW QUALITY PROTEIN: histidine-rich glycoprotein [Delphinapterus leucas]|uniref:Histidine-rich glycoprotein n=1 Tax=Delphinapterus leucas TaxID=9749 RepID=A0A7F8K7J9_DELLE|nr:LOW QUALITY PROTEIN: histidine-rich glycoprotein [Delphinapterus leucas]
MKLLTATLFFILLIPLQRSCAVSPTGCDAAEPVAGKALDLINKGRWDGYLFQLLWVADVHLDKMLWRCPWQKEQEFYLGNKKIGFFLKKTLGCHMLLTHCFLGIPQGSTAVYYLVLDVKESDCSVLSRKHWADCEPSVSIGPSEIVIGQCKVIAITLLDGSQNLRVNDFNCTTSPGERTNYYLDFSVRNCSSHHFPSLCEILDTGNSGLHAEGWAKGKIFGFCRADLSYDVEDSDLETPKDIVINYDVFNLKEHTNISGVKHRLGHALHSGLVYLLLLYQTGI